MDDLALMADAIFNTLTSIFNLYTANLLLSGVLALWVLRKVAKLFRHL